VICLFFLFFRYCSLLFRYLPLLCGVPIEPSCEHGQNAHNPKRNVSDRRPFALRVRGLLQRLLGFVQGRLALGLDRSHRLELLALGTRSRLCLLFTRADEVEV
jgi:hypothetical protein